VRARAVAAAVVAVCTAGGVARAGSPLEGFFANQKIGGYIQADYLHSQLSENQLDDRTGEPLNLDRFMLRRARLNLAGSWRYFEYALQVDLNSVNGFQVGFRQVEAAVKWPSRTDGAPPIVRLGAGVFRAPFGFEVSDQNDPQRLFAERSLTGTAFFPGEFDVGARLQGGVPWLYGVIAVQNGEPLGSRPFPGRDPNAAKDVLGRVQLRARLSSRVRLEAAFSAAWGRGFHGGTGATKPQVVWRDLNEDGLVQVSELVGIPSAAGAPATDFDRWGVEGDVQLHVDVPKIGELMIYAEAARGVNLDRGVRPADPIALGRDQREIGVYAAVTQELTRWALVGFRFDYYEPSLDEARLQGGVLARSRERFFTYSLAAAARLEEWGIRARLLLDYTINRHPLGLDATGRPTTIASDVLTLRLQGEF
jgi:hypothetical protein